MSAKLDLSTVLDQTLFGLYTLTMLRDVEDFIEFSESNIGWQKNRELRRAEQECNETKFDDQKLEAQYRDKCLKARNIGSMSALRSAFGMLGLSR